MIRPLFVTSLLAVIAEVRAQINTLPADKITAKPGSCFKWSEQYIGNDKGQFKDDITVIEDDNPDYITNKHRMYGFMACTVRKENATPTRKEGQLNGLKAILSNGDRADDILLNTWGQMQGDCSAYITPQDQTIVAVDFIETGGAITAMSVITDNGYYRKYGIEDSTSVTKGYRFTAEVPWVGLYGTMTADYPTSFGIVSMDVTCDFSYLKGGSTATQDSGPMEIPITDVSISEQYLRPSIAVVILIVVIVLLIVAGIVFLILWLQKKKHTAKHPSENENKSISMSKIAFEESASERIEEATNIVSPKGQEVIKIDSEDENTKLLAQISLLHEQNQKIDEKSVSEELDDLEKQLDCKEPEMVTPVEKVQSDQQTEVQEETAVVNEELEKEKQENERKMMEIEDNLMRQVIEEETRAKEVETIIKEEEERAEQTGGLTQRRVLIAPKKQSPKPQREQSPKPHDSTEISHRTMLEIASAYNVNVEDLAKESGLIFPNQPEVSNDNRTFAAQLKQLTNQRKALEAERKALVLEQIESKRSARQGYNNDDETQLLNVTHRSQSVSHMEKPDPINPMVTDRSNYIAQVDISKIEDFESQMVAGGHNTLERYRQRLMRSVEHLDQRMQYNNRQSNQMNGINNLYENSNDDLAGYGQNYRQGVNTKMDNKTPLKDSFLNVNSGRHSINGSLKVHTPDRLSNQDPEEQKPIYDIGHFKPKPPNKNLLKAGYIDPSWINKINKRVKKNKKKLKAPSKEPSLLPDQQSIIASLPSPSMDRPVSELNKTPMNDQSGYVKQEELEDEKLVSDNTQRQQAAEEQDKLFTTSAQNSRHGAPAVVQPAPVFSNRFHRQPIVNRIQTQGNYSEVNVIGPRKRSHVLDDKSNQDFVSHGGDSVIIKPPSHVTGARPEGRQGRVLDGGPMLFGEEQIVQQEQFETIRD